MMSFATGLHIITTLRKKASSWKTKRNFKRYCETRLNFSNKILVKNKEKHFLESSNKVFLFAVFYVPDFQQNVFQLTELSFIFIISITQESFYNALTKSLRNIIKVDMNETSRKAVKHILLDSRDDNYILLSIKKEGKDEKKLLNQTWFLGITET